MSKVQTVIFDLGGVLIDWNPRYLYRKIFEDESEMEFFLNNITTPGWNEAQDAGRPILEANALLTELYPEHEDKILAFYGRWTEMLNGGIGDTVEILKDLKSTGIPVFALTNWSAETWPHAVERYEFLQWFDGILVSGQEQLKKPDPAIYHLMEERFPLKLTSSLFIDDSIRNVEAARAVGLESLHYRDSILLRSELELLGLLS